MRSSRAMEDVTPRRQVLRLLPVGNQRGAHITTRTNEVLETFVRFLF